MPDLTANASTFRAGRFSFTGYIATIPATVVHSGTLSATPTFPAQAISITTAGGAAASVVRGMTVVISLAGVEKGRLRIADSGTISSTTLPVNEVSKGAVNLASGDTFQVLDDYRIWDKLVSATAALNKDSRILVSDNTSNPPPVANAGGLWFGFVDAGQTFATVTFSAATSFVVDPDSAGTLTYLWAVGDGTITVGTTTTSAITATFPVGFRHITLTVTDSGNSKSTTRKVPVYVFSDASPPLAVRMDNLHLEAAQGGNISFSLPRGSESAISTMPDGALIVYFEREYYAGVQGSVGSDAANRSHIKFAGFLVRDTISINRDGSAVIFEAVSPLAILDQHTPALPQLMVQKISPTKWRHIKSLSINRALHYLIYWHTTALLYFDFIWVSGADLAYNRLAANDASSVGAEIRDIASSINVDFTCDRLGRLLLVRNPVYMSTSDRSALTTAYNLTTADLKEVELPREHRGTVKFVRGEGITAGQTVALNRPVFSNAPGNAPYALGTGSETLGKQIVVNQADLNRRAGMHFARLNGLFNGLHVPQGARFMLPAGYDVFDPAYRNWLTLTLAASTNKRAVAFSTSLRWLIDSMDISYDMDTGMKTVAMIASAETYGENGTTYVPPTPPENGLPEIPPIDLDFPGTPFPPPLSPNGPGNMAVILTNGVANTASWNTSEGAGGPAWTFYTNVSLGIGGNIVDAVVDPANPDEARIVTTTEIGKLVDLLTTPVYTSQHTFATAITDSVQNRCIEATRGLANLFVCVSYYKDAAGHEGTWSIASTDGATWGTETQLSAHYHPGGLRSGMGVYVDRSGTYAYATRMTSTANNPAFEAVRASTPFTSWSTFASPLISGNVQPGWLHFPWSGNDTIVYHGGLTGGAGSTAAAQFMWRVKNITKTVITPNDGANDFAPRFPRSIHAADNNPLRVAAVVIYSAATDQEAVFVSSDGGANWTQIGTTVNSGTSYRCASVSDSGYDYFWGSNSTIAVGNHDALVAGVGLLDSRTGDLATLSTSARILNIFGG